jgi:ABC-2 type transport system permease protein
MSGLTGLLRVVCAEAVKQHWAFYNNPSVYVVILIWPILGFCGAYYAFMPFMGTRGSPMSDQSILIFALTGYLGYTFFVSLIQSAWRFSFERFWGTLELLLVTPTSMMAIIIGNATGALFESVWMFTTFFLGFGMLFGHLHLHLGMLALSLAVLTVGALAWGALLNSLFLFSRDASFLFAVFEDPMEFFSGVRFPVEFFPLWLRYISYLFPLTWSLGFLRGALIDGQSLVQLWKPAAVNLAVAAGQLLLTYVLAVVGERQARRTGQYALY